MSYLESCSTNKPLDSNEIYISKKVRIDPKFITLQISIRTDKQGTLKIYHSYDGNDYETYGDEVEIENTSHRQFSIKGVYLYVEFKNTSEDTQTYFNLISKLSDQPREEASYNSGVTYQNSLCYARNPLNGVVELRVDSSGNLLVSGSGGGGVTSDVNVTNTNLDVTEANSQDILDSLQSFTDNISFNTENSLWVAVNDVLNPVQVENKTGNKLDVYDASNNVVLNDIKTDLDQFKFTGEQLKVDVSGQSLVVNTISGFSLETTQQGLLNTVQIPPVATLILDSPEGISAYADSVPVPTIDTYKRKGWYYTNTNAGNKYNYYFYSNGNTTQTLADITAAWCICENDSITTTSSIVNPIISIYTVGNLNIWYQSSRVYAANVNMVAGMKYLCYWGVEPSVYPELPRIQLTLATSNGTQLPTETILTMSVGSDSGASAGIVKNLMTHIGWRNSSNEFITELIGDADYISTDVRILDKLSSGITVNTITGFATETTLGDIKTDIDKLTFSNNKLLCDVSGQTLSVNTITGFATETTLNQIDMTLSGGNLSTQSTVENKANNNLRVDLYADNGTSQEKLTSVSGKLEVHNMDAKISEVTSALTTTNTYLDRIQYDASGNLKTNIENSSLDCHIYGSSNGSTWHHIKTNANGVIHTHLETVASGALSATVSSGNYNSLDVSVKNSSLPVNSVNSGSWGNAVNNGSLNGNQYTSGFDISASAYIYVIYRDGSTGVFDSIQVEFSFDNTNWYYLNDSISPSTPMGQSYRQGTLNDKRKYGWNYMRFKNNGNSSLSTVYITILGSSI
jgi:hypothetical protein